jgi:indolepyruvate ferredoxin oxidoreductase
MEVAAPSLRDVTLDDKYVVEQGTIYLTGVQALVKIPLVLRQLDRQAGLNTAGFISGYRGSPLSTLDQQLWKAKRFLADNQIRFVPGVNEELAATAVWGTQQLTFEPQAKVDGVFAIWYGKSPGVDRAMDALRHGNAAGSSANGGALLLAGDDHPGRSATVPNQSELSFIAAAIPVLNPASIDDFLRLGVHGIAMSRYSGCWTGMIVLAETVDGAASIDVDIDQLRPVVPDASGPSRQIRWPDPHSRAEARLHEERLPAVLRYARANRLNRLIFGRHDARLGIIATGKAFLDVRHALTSLGIDEVRAESLGLKLMKCDLIWPLEPVSAREFVSGLQEVLVVEEKRATIETQLKELLFNDPVRPRVLGKTAGPALSDANPGQVLFPVKGELTPAMIAAVLVKRLEALGLSPQDEKALTDALSAVEARDSVSKRPGSPAIPNNPSAILSLGGRTPTYCSGCPHNTSTKVPKGSRALAGIGCHTMAQWIYPESTAPFCQMGGEGVVWVGQAAFTKTEHMFVNLGDGTFYHSGLLAIRQAISAGVNITYKILYNDAVAMTGGQPVDGTMPVPNLASVLLAEGVKRVVVVSDDPKKYRGALTLPQGVRALDRRELDGVQRELRIMPGCTVIIYDQTCAAEKRRRRKSGVYPDPARHVVINPDVCEGCGDCNQTSNCLSVVPLETSLGRKRAIDHSSCNKDYSCLDGFCPSFVTVEGGHRRKGARRALDRSDVPPSPSLPTLDTVPYNILVAGIGGSGVVTIGAILGMAAHLDSRAVSVLDMTGLAQKGGAVFSHVQIATDRRSLNAARIRSADLLLSCDIATTLEPDAVVTLDSNRSRIISTNAEAPTGSFSRNPDLPEVALLARRELEAIVGRERLEIVDAASMAHALLGSTVQANVLLLGYAWQKGNIPLSGAAIKRAIELNGAAVEDAIAAFDWGRVLAASPEKFSGTHSSVPQQIPRTLDDIIAHRSRLLLGYQGPSLSRRYEDLVARVRYAEESCRSGSLELAKATARGYYKFLAIKDEYEVARLHLDPRFLEAIAREFEGDYRLNYHLAPPLLAKREEGSGHLRKSTFGPWVLFGFKLLSRFRFLRNCAVDPFARSRERRFELELLKDYENAVNLVVKNVTAETYDSCLALLSYPEQVRGYGHVRQASFERIRSEIEHLISTIARQPERSVAAMQTGPLA